MGLHDLAPGKADAQGRAQDAVADAAAGVEISEMPLEIEAFLTSYTPKFICLDCLGAVTEREQDDVRNAITTLVAERRAETQIGECLNCNATAFVVRRRSTEEPGSSRVQRLRSVFHSS
jgi:hypothetical protein